MIDIFYITSYNKEIIMIIHNAADVAALDAVWNEIVSRWIGPFIIMFMGAFSLKFLLNRQWTQFITFLAMGIMVTVIVYIAPVMFSQNSAAVESVSSVVKQIN